jgi:hypothetical protein
VCKTHDSMDTVAELTGYDRGYRFNPHLNHITKTNDLSCIQCHQAHKADTIVCLDCHRAMRFR